MYDGSPILPQQSHCGTESGTTAAFGTVRINSSTQKSSWVMKEFRRQEVNLKFPELKYLLFGVINSQLLEHNF